VRPRFIHITSLGDLELQRVNPRIGSTVVPRHIAALEATVRDPRKSCCLRDNVDRRRFEFLDSEGSIHLTQAQIGQPSREKARDDARDLMRIENNRIPVTQTRAFDFGGKHGVIGNEIMPDTLGNLVGVRFLSCAVDRIVGECTR